MKRLFTGFKMPGDTFGRLLLGLILFITLLGLLPWEPQGPFDARDWSRIEGAHVTLPWWQLFIEPFAALGHMITGAPDFRQATISLLLWAGLGAGIWTLLRGRHLVWWRRLLRAVGAALFAAWLIPAYMLFFFHVHLPGWQLELDDGNWLVADLQSHTLGSHDGLVTATQNLQWHHERGYGVVAITEHVQPRASLYAEVLAEQLVGPVVIPGFEVSNEYNGYMLALGLESPELPAPRDPQETDYSGRFAREISTNHHGTVISMAWRLKPEDVVALADAGVHVFELINVTHPDIPDNVREKMLQLEKEGRIRLVSSTDWHGWGGNTRAWTLLQAEKGGLEMPREQQKRLTLNLLREGDRSQVVPVVAGYQGEVRGLRLALTPLTEAARYAAELSPSRLLGWWLWGVLLWLVARQLSSRGIAAGRTLWATAVMVMSTLLLWRGVELYLITPQGDMMLSTETHDQGRIAICVAALPLLVSLWQLWYLLTEDKGSVPLTSV